MSNTKSFMYALVIFAIVALIVFLIRLWVVDTSDFVKGVTFITAIVSGVFATVWRGIYNSSNAEIHGNSYDRNGGGYSECLCWPCQNKRKRIARNR